MADSIPGILSSKEQARLNYEKHRDKFVDSNEQLVNSETFLNLLVKEMTNQDPLEPTSNTEFITQMAQFSNLQYAKDSSTYAMANYASSLVGKTATASQQDGADLVTKTGVVTDVKKVGNSYTVTIDGKDFDISKITAVSDTNSVSDTNNTQLGDTIARASSMIGMYATVKARTDKGDVYDSGFITSIQVKDGEITAVINNIGYKLTDIVEVTYATTVEPDGSEGETVPPVTNEKGDDKADNTNNGTSADAAADKADSTMKAAGRAMSREIVEEAAGTLAPETESKDLEDLRDFDDSDDPYDV